MKFRLFSYENFEEKSHLQWVLRKRYAHFRQEKFDIARLNKNFGASRTYKLCNKDCNRTAIV